MRTIAARKTRFASISDEESRVFVETHHRQGMAKPGGSQISYGLFLNDELLAVAIFCNPRTRGMQKKYTSELFRLAFKREVRIVGGASKLIKGFIRDKKPANLFTYQSVEGEAGLVYEKSGMSLVKEAKPKQILLKNGVNLHERKNNRSDWFSLEQATSRGPDALLGLTIGEVFHSDGKRKTNIEIFQEHLNYNLVQVPGDRIYEWENPEVFFYTYKISIASEGFYYYGRKIIRGKAPTIEDCMADGYYGSGGYSFRRWRETKPKSELLKEILEIYSSWRKVVRAEELLIGDLYKTDPFCLNVRPGGAGTTQLSSPGCIKKCAIHGLVMHMGESCCSCTASKSISEKICSIHGKVIFRGGTCGKCLVSKSLSKKLCPIHEWSTHRGQMCVSCQNSRVYSKKLCAIHGLSAHQGDVCRLCLSSASFSLLQCPVHGESLHQGTQCRKCVNEKSDTLAKCSIHGESTHRGGSCLKCAVAKTIELSNCNVHGLVKHQNGLCLSCKNAKSWTVQNCTIHGETPFYGNNCKRCSTKNKELKICSIHGEVKHTGKTCYKCEAEKRNKLRICDIHGETPFQGKYCRKCLIAKQFEEKECPTHGIAKHRNGKCSKCHTASMLKTLNCEVHGATIHRGKQCLNCLNSK